MEALRLALTRPEDMAHRLEEVLFADELNLAAFRALAGADTVHDAIESADPRAADLLQRLAVEDTDSNPDDVVARLAELAAQRVLADLEAQVRLTPDRFGELSPSVSWLKVTTAELREPSSRNDAATRLVAWLREGGGAST